MAEIQNLTDTEFVAYLGDIDLRPANAEEITLTWRELNRRKREAEARSIRRHWELRVIARQVDEIRTAVRQAGISKHEGEL